MDDSDKAAALGRLRVLSDLSQREAARRIGVRPSVLRSWEAGDTSPLDPQLHLALRVYGHDTQQLLCPRTPLVSHSAPGVLTVGNQSIDTAAIRLTHTESSDANRRILTEYLAAVRRERGTAVRDTVELRSVDLKQLAVELDLTDHNLDALLGELFGLTTAGARTATRALLVAGLMGVAAWSSLTTGWFRPSFAQLEASVITSRTESAAVEMVAVTRPTMLAAHGARFAVVSPRQPAGPLFSVDRRPAHLEHRALPVDPVQTRTSPFSLWPSARPARPALG